MAKLIGGFLVVALSFLAVPDAHAQEPHHRVSVSAGLGTLPDLAESLGNALGSVFTVGHRTAVRGTPVAFVAQYERFLSRRVAVLGAGGVQRIRRDTFVDNDLRGTLSTTYTHALAGLNVHYVRGRTAWVYSGASVGLGLRRESFQGDTGRVHETDALPGFQVTAIGVGIRRPVGAFVELGAGYRGIFAFGLSYEF